MTIETIVKKPELIQLHETDFLTSAASSIFKKIINNIQWVEKNIPIGYVLFFYQSMSIDAPSSNIWKFCNGDLISDFDSPLDGKYLPDLRGKFPKGSDSEIGSSGGNSNINLSHNHGGVTGWFDDRRTSKMADDSNTAYTGVNHQHVIWPSWPALNSTIPPYVDLQAYMRYK